MTDVEYTPPDPWENVALHLATAVYRLTSPGGVDVSEAQLWRNHAAKVLSGETSLDLAAINEPAAEAYFDELAQSWRCSVCDAALKADGDCPRCDVPDDELADMARYAAETDGAS